MKVMFANYLLPLSTILCSITSLGLVDAKNVAGVETFHDADGRLQRRFSSDDSVLLARDAKRLPIDIDKIIGENTKLFKRDPKRLPLDINAIIEQEESLLKRDRSQKQKDFQAAGGNLHISPVSLDSKITALKEATVFFSYARDDVELSGRLGDENQDLIVIAPTNEAISRLSKKPWEFPRNIETLESAGAGEVEIDQAIRQNVLKFVRSHVVAYDENHSHGDCGSGYITLKSVDYESSASRGSGGDILLRRDGDSFYVASVRDKKFHKVEKVETAVNGVVLVIDSCLVMP